VEECDQHRHRLLLEGRVVEAVLAPRDILPKGQPANGMIVSANPSHMRNRTIRSTAFCAEPCFLPANATF